MRRVSDPLGKSTAISAARLHRATMLQWRLCIEHHALSFNLLALSLFLSLSFISSPLPSSPTSPTTSPYCKVRVAEFKSQSECRLGASRVCIQVAPFVYTFACFLNAPRRCVYVCVFFYACTSCCLRSRLLKIPTDLRESVSSRQRDYRCNTLPARYSECLNLADNSHTLMLQ